MKKWQQVAEQMAATAAAQQAQQQPQQQAPQVQAPPAPNDGFQRATRPSLEEHSGLRQAFVPRPDPTLQPSSTPAQQPAAGTQRASTFSDPTHRQFPTSDGYPVYRQGDAAWGHDRIGNSSGTMGRYGCAVAAVSSAVSGISGQTVTPGQMDHYMTQHHGFSGDAISNWGAMGHTVNPPVDVHRTSGMNADRVNRELAAGRPVVMGVDYKTGSGANRQAGHDGRTDHWITVTGRTADGGYRANDPATGQAITMHARADGRLEADNAARNGAHYISTGDAATFSRGPANRTTGATPGSTGTTGTTPAHQPTGATPQVQGPAQHGPVQSNGFRSVDPATFRAGGTDSLAAKVIGNAEGTRTANGGFRAAYNGHTDPGNAAHNIGSFSVQGAKARQAHGDPAQADQVQLNELQRATPAYQQACQRAGLDPNNSLLLSSYYDMQTQSPATARAFLNQLPQLAQQGVTSQNITNARVQAFNNNGMHGGWHAPGHEAQVQHDAARRQAALVAALRAQGLAN